MCSLKLKKSDFPKAQQILVPWALEGDVQWSVVQYNYQASFIKNVKALNRSGWHDT